MNTERETRQQESMEEYPAYAEELLMMRDEDQSALLERQHGDLPKEKVDAILEKNRERLEEIIDDIGWPTISKVGEKASKAAWLLAQHADHDVEFQERCLSLLQECEEGEVSLSNIAYLTDRVRANRGEPQLYGTQFRHNEQGEPEPKPIENEEQVDERRAAMGMQSLEEYAEGFKNPPKEGDIL